MSVEPELKVESARIPFRRTLDSGRISALKTFKTRITDWAEPSPYVTEEAIVVDVIVERERRIDDIIKWSEPITFDHLHVDVKRFEDLIEHKKAAGYTVSIRDAVLAYMLVFEWGRRPVIYGFLKTFPEWKDIRIETVGEALSRLAAENYIGVVHTPEKKAVPLPYVSPIMPPREVLYEVNRDIKDTLLKKLRWWSPT